MTQPSAKSPEPAKQLQLKAVRRRYVNEVKRALEANARNPFKFKMNDDTDVGHSATTCVTAWNEKSDSCILVKADERDFQSMRNVEDVEEFARLKVATALLLTCSIHSNQ